MITLVSSAADEASSRSSKRVTATHLKRIVEKEQQLDFLWDITSKVADAPAPSEKPEDPDAGDGIGRKRKGSGKRRTKDDDDF